jgi:hypothetical protein
MLSNFLSTHILMILSRVTSLTDCSVYIILGKKKCTNKAVPIAGLGGPYGILGHNAVQFREILTFWRKMSLELLM